VFLLEGVDMKREVLMESEFVGVEEFWKEEGDLFVCNLFIFRTMDSI
jgi:hypothetical protein